MCLLLYLVFTSVGKSLVNTLSIESIVLSTYSSIFSNSVLYIECLLVLLPTVCPITKPLLHINLNTPAKKDSCVVAL